VAQPCNIQTLKGDFWGKVFLELLPVSPYTSYYKKGGKNKEHIFPLEKLIL